MKNYWKKHKAQVLIVAIVVLGGGYYWYTKAHTTTAVIQYKTTVATKGSLTTSISGSGNVIVDQLATVDPTITGTVADLKVKVGDSVKKGEVLFTIVNNDLSVSNDKAIATLQQAKNSVESAKLSLQQAKADLRAAQRDNTSSSDQKKILDKKINIAENSLVASQKSYAATLADYNNQLTNGEKRTVKAPISGTVSAINIKNGDDLSRLSSSSNANNAPIVIGDLQTLKAQVSVNEVDIPNVSLGQKVMMTFGAIDGLSVAGKVEKMDALGTITQGVVNYSVTIGFDTLDARIRPSMSVSAKIITQVKQDVLLVPNSALKVQGNKTIVEVLKKNAQAPEQRNIEIGVANNSETEIVSGLQAGEEVVTQTIDPNAKATTTTISNNRGGMGILGGR